jgi:hypothetical protein
LKEAAPPRPEKDSQPEEEILNLESKQFVHKVHGGLLLLASYSSKFQLRLLEILN